MTLLFLSSQGLSIAQTTTLAPFPRVPCTAEADEWSLGMWKQLHIPTALAREAQRYGRHFDLLQCFDPS